MAEKITLTAPDSVVLAAPDYEVGEFGVNSGWHLSPAKGVRDVNAAQFWVTLVSPTTGATRRLVLWQGQAAQTAARQFNKLNMAGANASLERRLLDRAQVVLAQLAGAISGTPDAP